MVSQGAGSDRDLRRLTSELNGLKALKRKWEPQLKEKQVALNVALGNCCKTLFDLHHFATLPHTG